MIYIDVVHGIIEYPDYIFEIVNTEEFQRLRNLKQLGASPWVFPCGTHTRFEHCLGVCHLVDKFLSYLEKNSKINVSEYHRKCIMIAGLLHDVGHGPFSHMWEQFIHLKEHKNWDHEHTSCEITREIFKNNAIKLSKDPIEHSTGIELITAFITGNVNVLQEILGPDNMYLSEIVNNKFCFIDVDKWDYIVRDAYYLNNAISIPKGFQQIFKDARVIKDHHHVSHISYHYKEYHLIYELFENRSILHMRCYKHAEVVGVNQLLVDIFLAAEDAGFLFKSVKLSEAHLHPNVYKYLDDTIIEMIAISDDPILKTAQHLIKRLKTRQLYPIVYMSKEKSKDLLLDDQTSARLFQIERKIPTVEESMPNSILLHNDKGEIVNKDQCGFERFVVYSVDP